MTVPKIILAILITCRCIAQDVPKYSNDILVYGKVKTEFKINLSELKEYNSKSIPDVTIYNHLGEQKSISKNLKGILLKDVLNKVAIQSESSKDLCEIYFVLEALDGYKIVYSWNELFNTSAGDHVYLITEKNDKLIEQMEDRILCLSAKDFKTGRRNIKWLNKIRVERVK